MGIEHIVSEVAPERLLFGTDVGFGAAPGTREYRMGQILRLDIPEGDSALILGGNAQRHGTLNEKPTEPDHIWLELGICV